VEDAEEHPVEEGLAMAVQEQQENIVAGENVEEQMQQAAKIPWEGCYEYPPAAQP